MDGVILINFGKIKEPTPVNDCTYVLALLNALFVPFEVLKPCAENDLVIATVPSCCSVYLIVETGSKTPYVPENKFSEYEVKSILKFTNPT